MQQNSFFPELKGNFGFGCLRLPMQGDVIDTVELNAMVDAYLNAGFSYFDTAHGYLNCLSEPALRECLTSRYPRDRYILTDKLSGSFLTKAEDVRPFFQRQLEICGVDYFDFYLMHSQSRESYAQFCQLHCYETVMELKSEGKFRHFGISFHDTAEVLDQILREHPEIEVVQIQLNYLDYEDPAVQGRQCYEICQKYNKPVFIMEPIKGGSLSSLPSKAAELFAVAGGTPASYALRFASGFDNVAMVLSGMSTLSQVEENLNTMAHFMPLTQKEHVMIMTVADLIREQNLIGCTACRYCVAGCPMHISIPDLFACMNTQKQCGDWSSTYYYHSVYTLKGGKASDCIHCGGCEKICPQHLPIREHLQEVATLFEETD